MRNIESEILRATRSEYETTLLLYYIVRLFVFECVHVEFRKASCSLVACTSRVCVQPRRTNFTATLHVAKRWTEFSLA